MNDNTPSASEQLLILVCKAVLWYIGIRFIFFPFLAVVIAKLTGVL
jgi:hypothetical protein